MAQIEYGSADFEDIETEESRLKKRIDEINSIKDFQANKEKRQIEKMKYRREVLPEAFKYLTGLDMGEMMFIEYSDLFDYMSEAGHAFNIKDYLDYKGLLYPGQDDKVDEFHQDRKDRTQKIIKQYFLNK